MTHQTPKGAPPPSLSVDEIDDYLILFDLDETLVYVVATSDEKWSEEARLAVANHSFTVTTAENTFCVVVRPYAQEILRHCEKNYAVGFFTAAEECYAEPIITRLLPTVRKEYCFFRTSCQSDQTDSGLQCTKRLDLPGLPDLSRVILIDNLAPANVHPEENGLYCIAFELSQQITWTDLKDDTILWSIQRIVDRAVASGDVRPTISKANTLFRDMVGSHTK